MNDYYSAMTSTIGEIHIVTQGDFVVGLLWNKKSVARLFPQYTQQETILHKKAKKQISRFLNGELYQFDLPIKLIGTPFQKAVWQELLKIPYGETKSYSEIANAIKNAKAVRAVGAANGKNKISIIIPCHRVIGKNGTLTGFAGGLTIKERLLVLEQNY